MANHITQKELVSISDNLSHKSQLFGFCLALPVLPVSSLSSQAATTTNYAEWTYPDGGSGQAKERDWFKDTD